MTLDRALETAKWNIERGRQGYIYRVGPAYMYGIQRPNEPRRDRWYVQKGYKVTVAGFWTFEEFIGAHQ